VERLVNYTEQVLKFDFG